MRTFSEVYRPGSVTRTTATEMMTLAVHADRSCLVITCHTCAPVDGRRVELNLPLGRSREAMAAMKSHADDCHRR